MQPMQPGWKKQVMLTAIGKEMHQWQ